MTSIGLIFDTETGNTNKVGVIITKCFPENTVEVFSAAELTPEILDRYNNWIFGTPSMQKGKLADNWQQFIEGPEYDFSGKTIALFGLGDQVNYPNEFVDGLGVLYQHLSQQGATIIGSWPTDGYNFNQSKAIINDQFVGLVIDEDNQATLTKDRISIWVAQISKLFDIH